MYTLKKPNIATAGMNRRPACHPAAFWIAAFNLVATHARNGGSIVINLNERPVAVEQIISYNTRRGSSPFSRFV